MIVSVPLLIKIADTNKINEHICEVPTLTNKKENEEIKWTEETTTQHQEEIAVKDNKA